MLCVSSVKPSFPCALLSDRSTLLLLLFLVVASRISDRKVGLILQGDGFIVRLLPIDNTFTLQLKEEVVGSQGELWLVSGLAP